jgi:hypothetical protein
MLFMTVFTYEPSARDEVIHRRVEKGAMVPKGMTGARVRQPAAFAVFVCFGDAR